MAVEHPYREQHGKRELLIGDRAHGIQTHADCRVHGSNQEMQGQVHAQAVRVVRLRAWVSGARGSQIADSWHRLAKRHNAKAVAILSSKEHRHSIGSVQDTPCQFVRYIKAINDSTEAPRTLTT